MEASTCTVSVRGLCAFTAQQGDLDRRFAPAATALEGMMGQSAVVARRGAAYESEVTLEGRCGDLLVRGRADGYDPMAVRLEEIKTIRGGPESVPANRSALHWAQLHTYGALLCRQRGLQRLDLALVYVDAATQHETSLHQCMTAAELEALFTARCDAYLAWAQQEAAHRAAREEALGSLAFPPGSFRPGQRGLAQAVYRAAVDGRCLLAQAPTGIGKTLGVLYPLLRAMPGQRLDKLAYLTCKGTGRITALEALQRLRDAAPGKPLRVLTMVAREQACEHPDRACHGASCPLAQGFYDRLPQARAQAVEAGWLEPAELRRIALAHGICPYYLGQELLRWADVLVGDVHHAFDTHGVLLQLAQAEGWRLALAVDEAHNLVERTRQMYSGSLKAAQVRAAAAHAPARLRRVFGPLWRAIVDLGSAQTADYVVHDEIPDALVHALQDLTGAIGDHLQDEPTATGPLLDFHFEALRLQRLLDRHGPHSLFEVRRGVAAATDEDLAGNADADVTVAVRNIVPGPHLRQRWSLCHTASLFSATLAPAHYQRDLLGLPDDAGYVDVPPAFPPEHLQVRIARNLSTRYPHRQATLGTVVELLASQYAAHPGNYLAFFSSFAYLEQAADLLQSRHPALPQWRQPRTAGDEERRAFLHCFAQDGRGIGFAVLGGAFAEGVDLPGTRLVGAFVATLGLPPVSAAQDALRARLDTLFEPGHGYADLVPGLQKVVQAAGRVLRTPEDRGWLWLMDDRYGRPEVQRLLPPWWRLSDA